MIDYDDVYDATLSTFLSVFGSLIDVLLQQLIIKIMNIEWAGIIPEFPQMASNNMLLNTRQ